MAVQNTTEISTATVQRETSGLGLYVLLLSVQTGGAALVFINGLPIYRQIVGDFAGHKPDPGILWWAVVAVILIQFAYWLRVRLQPPLPQSAHVVIGHLASFIARLSFIFASSSFTVIFFARFDQLNLPLPRIAMLLALLFSLFCYSLELERLARALSPPEAISTKKSLIRSSGRVNFNPRTNI